MGNLDKKVTGSAYLALFSRLDELNLRPSAWTKDARMATMEKLRKNSIFIEYIAAWRDATIFIEKS